MSAPIYLYDEGFPHLPSGEWAWVVMEEGADPAFLVYGCPCGNNCQVTNCIIPVVRVKEPKSWEWDGDWDAPTLSPSIQRRIQCDWHGYLTKGVFESV